MRLPSFSGLLTIAALASSVLGASVPAREFELEDRATGTKYVFAHFIVGLIYPLSEAIQMSNIKFQVGIVASYVQADWTADMQLAQAIGIDGFALNIGQHGRIAIHFYESNIYIRDGLL